MVAGVNQVLQDHPLAALVQPENFVGWIFEISYDTARVMTNDLWKARALGIPHNCFLVAASFDPREFAQVPESDQEVLLLRVTGPARLPQDDDLVRAKIDYFKDQESTFPNGETGGLDSITLNEMQFSGLECRILGTFYFHDNDLWLGSDLESFASAARLNVYRPRGKALTTIVNYVDPLRKRAAQEEAARLGLGREVAPFRIGTVRYTSTARLHRRDKAELVPVYIQPSDFLARRTAVLGMTRTGKSNMVKQTVSVIKRVADQSGARIGQIIYDINGEYANVNQQDAGSIADLYAEDTVRYRMLPAEGVQDLRTNFYEQVLEGFSIITRELREAGRTTTDYINAFVNMSLDEPDRQEVSEHKRWQVRVAAYKVLLYRAGFTPPGNYLVKFEANQKVRDAVSQVAGDSLPDPKHGLTLPQATRWFIAARDAHQQGSLPSSGSRKPWVDDALNILLNMIVQRNDSGQFISGYRILAEASRYHSPVRSTDVAQEIYDYLADGKIVILDLSVGDPIIRERLSTDIAAAIFHRSMDLFVRGETPPHIVVYVEEAHNLLGRDLKLTETWPRLAKEGAKYRIALVYATQEISSIHPNILANTENWFVSHLNNEREIRELAQFYDFADFRVSLARAQDVGFARVKTLSSPFVVPVQIDKFDPTRPQEESVSDSGGIE